MQDLPYASRSNRLIGQIIDSFIGAGPLIVAAIFSSFSDSLGTILFVVAIAWSIFYYFFCDGFTGGQSFGKRILDMHVIDAKMAARMNGAPATRPSRIWPMRRLRREA
jgi:uncharacterized RDD family membrane protein YckC